MKFTSLGTDLLATGIGVGICAGVTYHEYKAMNKEIKETTEKLGVSDEIISKEDVAKVLVVKNVIKWLI